jgi:hypothetical protein
MPVADTDTEIAKALVFISCQYCHGDGHRLPAERPTAHYANERVKLKEG